MGKIKLNSGGDTAAKAKAARRFEVVIIGDRCKGCGFCIEFCPKKILDYSNKLNVRGAHPPYVKDEESCTGCGMCDSVCPDFAIFVREKVKA